MSIKELVGEVELLKRYIEYVEEYPDEHKVKGNYPVCFNEWFDNDYQAELEEIEEEKKPSK